MICRSIVNKCCHLRWLPSLALLFSLALAPLLPAQIAMNEIMANNGGSVLAPNGSPEKYIEIYNGWGSAISLAGWSLTDNTNSPAKFVFPSGTIIPAHGYQIVWLDSATNDPGFHATFSLKSSGETVTLYQNGVPRETVKFGIQALDHPISRVPNGTGPWVLGKPTPLTNNVAAVLGTIYGLRINEWMSTNSTGADWLELYNPRTNGPVDLSGLIFTSITDGDIQTSISVLPALCFVSSNAFEVFTCDSKLSSGADHLNFKLSSTYGETTTLFNANQSQIIDRVVYGPGVRDRSMGRLPDGGSNYLATPYLFPLGRSTPGASNLMPLTNGVVINEILAHSAAPLENAVELYNTNSVDADISGWWFSDDQDIPNKYRIPLNTKVPARGYLVLYEYQFNPDGTGISPSFHLNYASGGELNLASANSIGTLTGFRQTKTFLPSEMGVSVGRYIKSDGGSDTVPMSMLSFGTTVTMSDSPSLLSTFRTGRGATNPYPMVGPVVISEIMFHPPDIITYFNGIPVATNDNSDEEFIEFRNITSRPVPLYSTNTASEYTNTWMVANAVDFTFPTNIVMPPGGTLLLVHFDPIIEPDLLDSFVLVYNVPPGTPILGPYKGKLSNKSGTVELYKTDTTHDAGFVPHIVVEKVKYEDATPWPTNTDGSGLSLQRLSLNGYANDQTNWFGASPTPGWNNTMDSAPFLSISPQSRIAVAGESITLSVSAGGRDPLQYQWYFETTKLTGQTSPNLALSNVQIGQAGRYSVTVSNTLGGVVSPASLLVVAAPSQISRPSIQANGSVLMNLLGAASGRVYVIETSSTLTNWSPLVVVTNSVRQNPLRDSSAINQPFRFYRSRLLP